MITKEKPKLINMIIRKREEGATHGERSSSQIVDNYNLQA